MKQVLIRHERLLDLVDLYPQGAQAELGVTMVEFADGSTWRFDPSNGFRKAASRLAAANAHRIVPCGTSSNVVTRLYRYVLTGGGGSGYNCQDSLNAQYCTNNQQSCTDTVCGSGFCASQECHFVK